MWSYRALPARLIPPRRKLTAFNGVPPVPEAEVNISLALCEDVARALTFPCDLMPLKDVVLQIIDRVGGKRERDYGLQVANQCLRYGLLELGLMRPDGTETWFSKTDCGHPTVWAAPINPAEAVWVEPREDGHYFIRRAVLAKSTAPAAPATTADQQLRAAGGSTPVAEEPSKEIVETTLAATEAADTAAKSKRTKKVQLEIAEAVKKIWPLDGIVPPDFGTADLMHAIEELYKREAAAKGSKEKPRDHPSWSSCKRFLEDQRNTVHDDR